jgi:hypothetical protein
MRLNSPTAWTWWSRIPYRSKMELMAKVKADQNMSYAMPMRETLEHS